MIFKIWDYLITNRELEHINLLKGEWQRLNYKTAKKLLQEGKKVRGKNWSNYEYMILDDDKKTLKFKLKNIDKFATGGSTIEGYFRDVYAYNKKSEWEIVE